MQPYFDLVTAQWHWCIESSCFLQILLSVACALCTNGWNFICNVFQMTHRITSPRCYGHARILMSMSRCCWPREGRISMHRMRMDAHLVIMQNNRRFMSNYRKQGQGACFLVWSSLNSTYFQWIINRVSVESFRLLIWLWKSLTTAKLCMQVRRK